MIKKPEFLKSISHWHQADIILKACVVKEGAYYVAGKRIEFIEVILLNLRPEEGRQHLRALIVNLKADPYEKMPHESAMYLRWYADNIWLFVPVQAEVQKFLATIPDFPFQQGSTLNAAGINYQSLKALEILKRLETLSPPNN